MGAQLGRRGPRAALRRRLLDQLVGASAADPLASERFTSTMPRPRRQRHHQPRVIGRRAAARSSRPNTGVSSVNEASRVAVAHQPEPQQVAGEGDDHGLEEQPGPGQRRAWCPGLAAQRRRHGEREAGDGQLVEQRLRPRLQKPAAADRQRGGAHSTPLLRRSVAQPLPLARRRLAETFGEANHAGEGEHRPPSAAGLSRSVWAMKGMPSATTKGEQMNTAMREAVVNCRPGRCSRTRRRTAGRRRGRRSQAVALRTAECHAAPTGIPAPRRRASAASLRERRHLGDRHLGGDLVQAPEETAQHQRGDRHAIEAGLAFSRHVGGSEEQCGARSSPAMRAAGVREGAMLISQPARRCRAGPQGDSPRILTSSTAGMAAPISWRRPRRARPAKRRRRHAGVQHAGQPAVVQQVGAHQQAQLRERQAAAARPADGQRHTRHDAERPTTQPCRRGWPRGAGRSRWMHRHGRQRAPGFARSAAGCQSSALRGIHHRWPAQRQQQREREPARGRRCVPVEEPVRQGPRHRGFGSVSRGRPALTRLVQAGAVLGAAHLAVGVGGAVPDPDRAAGAASWALQQRDVCRRCCRGRRMRRAVRQYQGTARELDVDHAARAVLDVEASCRLRRGAQLSRIARTSSRSAAVARRGQHGAERVASKRGSSSASPAHQRARVRPGAPRSRRCCCRGPLVFLERRSSR